MNRRTVLGYGGLAAFAGLSGCSTWADTGPAGVVLTHVELGNATGERQVFDVLVTYDGDIAHWDTYEVATGDGDQQRRVVVALDSPDDPGQVEVHVRVDGKRSGLDFTAHEEYAGERVVAIATYGMIENELRVRPHASDRPTTED